MTNLTLSGEEASVALSDGQGFFNSCSLTGTQDVLAVSGGSFTMPPDNDGRKISLGGVSNRFVMTDGVLTGRVAFAGTDARATVTGGRIVGRYAGLTFTSGQSGQLVLDGSAEFECAGFFGKSHDSENGVPYTGCPDSFIAFRGTAPKFRITGTKRYVNDGDFRYSAAFGTAGGEALSNPVKLRFVLPENGWTAAPLRNEVATLALYGNAVIEVDDTAFKRPLGRTRIPLVYDQGGFVYGKTSSIDVAGLNAANADTLPKGARFEYDAATKTLCVSLPGRGGLTVIVR